MQTWQLSATPGPQWALRYGVVFIPQRLTQLPHGCVEHEGAPPSFEYGGAVVHMASVTCVEGIVFRDQGWVF